MVLLADPALDNSSLAGRQSVQGGGVLLFLVLLLVRHKLHPNLLRHNGCLEKVKLVFENKMRALSLNLRIRSRLVVLGHAELVPVPSLGHDLRHHLALDLVVAHSLHLLPVLVEGVVGDHLDVALDLLCHGGKNCIKVAPEEFWQLKQNRDGLPED